MKKLTTLLLALLIVASCLAFAGCDDDTKCLDGYTHSFRNGYHDCYYCGKMYCEVTGSHDFTNIYGEPSAYCAKCGAEKSLETGPTIGGTILFGAVCLVIALIMHWIGLYNQSVFFIRAPLFAFIIFTLGFFLAYGVARGIIMAVCFVLYVVGSIKLNRKYLGYNDYV